MNNENKDLTTSQRCRACLVDGYEMCHLEDKCSNDTNAQNLLELFRACTSLEVSLNDNFPQYLCLDCMTKVSDWYQFRLQCTNAEEQLRTELKPNEHLQSREENKTCESKIEIKHEQPDDKTKIKSDPSLSVPLKQRTCDDCGKEFKYRTSMIKHKRKHSITSRSCPYCSESFSTAILLARHMEQMHAHLKTIKCTECGKAFFKQANLRLHLNVHSGVKRHMCEVCGMSFALAGNLAAHRRLHTGSKPYTCTECGRGFTQQAALRSHEASHSNRKDHVCADCGAAFSRAGALRNHCKRHLPEKPFVCNVCGKAFTFSSERKRHMVIHTGEKNHECLICGSRFNRSTNLAVHRRIHTGETPHLCNVCGKRFSQAHCLRTHMATHPSALQELAVPNAI